MESTYYKNNPSRIVINTSGYGVSEGWAEQVTLPNGKYYYTGVSSIISEYAREQGWDVKIVRYYGACIYCNINDRALDKHHFPIQIDDTDIKDFIDKIASEEDYDTYLSNLITF